MRLTFEGHIFLLFNNDTVDHNLSEILLNDVIVNANSYLTEQIIFISKAALHIHEERPERILTKI